MKVGRFGRAIFDCDDRGEASLVATVDDCLDTLEAAFQSEMWKQLPEQDRRRLVNRLYIILRDIGEEDKTGGT
jgi:hypothetical protein